VIGLWAEAVLDVLLTAIRVHGDVLRQDLHYTARTLGRAPGFTATAIVVSALGVAATTATFSITDHVLIRPLPFPESERLLKLWENDTLQGYRTTTCPPRTIATGRA
jgi:hypothetical protein